MIKVMKKALLLKPDIQQNQKFNGSKETSLKILSMNQSDLIRCFCEESSKNPFLIMHTTIWDALPFYSREPSLSDVICSQLMYAEKRIDEDMCLFLLSQLDGNGYFKCTFDELSQKSLYTPEALRSTIDILQCFDPVGCFCFSLSESLKVQSLVSEEAASETAYILCDELMLLADNELSQIEKKTGLSIAEIEEGLAFIRTLNPKPASQFANDAQYLQPEAVLTKENGSLHIEMLNQDIGFSLEDIDNSFLNEELKQQRQRAREMMSYLQKRTMTLLQILQFLCDRQQGFFLRNEPLRRCTMEEIADACGLHVSTVSRAVQGKSIEFNGRYIAIRSLCIRKGKKEYEVSDIVSQIEKWIREENQQKKLSDQKIQKRFEEMGIHISRRTVAKYRKELNIESTRSRGKREE